MTRNSISLWIVRLCLILSAAATFGGMAEQIRIQQASFTQPTSPAGPYTHSLRVRPTAHFITDEQLAMLGLARNGLYLGFPLLIVLGIAHQFMMVRTTPIRTNIMTRGLDKRLGLE